MHHVVVDNADYATMTVDDTIQISTLSIKQLTSKTRQNFCATNVEGWEQNVSDEIFKHMVGMSDILCKLRSYDYSH